MIIKVFGSKSVGKSTIAKLISKTLKDHNIEAICTTEDLDLVDLERNLKVISDESNGILKCEIKTINLKSETIPQYAKDYNESL